MLTGLKAYSGSEVDNLGFYYDSCSCGWWTMNSVSYASSLHYLTLGFSVTS